MVRGTVPPDASERAVASAAPDTVLGRSTADIFSREVKTDADVHIAEKMLRAPLLGEKIESKWNLALTREFDITNDSLDHHIKITQALLTACRHR